MSLITPNPTPLNSCEYYYQGTSITRTSSGTISLAGTSGSYNYTWYLPFNLSAFANKRITNIIFWAKRASKNSNAVGSTKKIAASYGTTISNAIAAKPDLGNARSLIDGDSWNSWDVTAAAATLQAGTGYIYLYNAAGSAYTEFYNNNTTDRPNLVVTLQDGLVYYWDGGGWKQCEVYYLLGSGWKRCEPNYWAGGQWHLLG